MYVNCNIYKIELTSPITYPWTPSKVTLGLEDPILSFFSKLDYVNYYKVPGFRFLAKGPKRDV